MTTFNYYSSYSSYSTAGTSQGTTIMLSPTSGTSIHDVTLVINPLQGGEFAVFLSAQGLQPGGTYLIEGITNGAHTSIVPLALTTSDSGFAADNQGNGIYSHVFGIDPRNAYTSVLLVYLPNNQVEGSVLVATATLG